MLLAVRQREGERPVKSQPPQSYLIFFFKLFHHHHFQLIFRLSKQLQNLLHSKPRSCCISVPLKDLNQLHLDLVFVPEIAPFQSKNSPERDTGWNSIAVRMTRRHNSILTPLPARAIGPRTQTNLGSLKDPEGSLKDPVLFRGSLAGP